MVVSESEIQEFYYDQQLSLTEVGKILKVTSTQVLWYMNRYGMPRRTRSEAGTKLDIPKTELERLYLIEKHSAGEIAQKYNTFTVTITRKLKKYNIPLRSLSESRILWGNVKYNGSSPSLKFKITRDTLEELYSTKHYTSNEIAKMYNVSTSTVLDALSRYKIPVRSASETMKINGYYDNLKHVNKHNTDSSYFNRYPNIPELKMFYILQKISPNMWEYVGNGDRIIDGLCPDFICENDKKIIEVFGDYWHDDNKRNLDKRRTQVGRTSVFNQMGYDLLIIWEYELKDIDKVINKLSNFIWGDI